MIIIVYTGPTIITLLLQCSQQCARQLTKAKSDPATEHSACYGLYWGFPTNTGEGLGRSYTGPGPGQGLNCDSDNLCLLPAYCRGKVIRASPLAGTADSPPPCQLCCSWPVPCKGQGQLCPLPTLASPISAHLHGKGRSGLTPTAVSVPVMQEAQAVV